MVKIKTMFTFGFTLELQRVRETLSSSAIEGRSYPRGLRSCPFYKHKRGSRHSSSVFDSGAESKEGRGYRP